MPNRRAALAALAVLACAPWARAANAPMRFAATWQAPAGDYRAGVLARHNGQWDVQAAVDLPTRGHGVLVRPGGELVAVARRPGDWLMRWRPGAAEGQWSWTEPDRAFTGHVIVSADGRRIYTTETNLETGAGLVGVRDTASLEKIGEWATGGTDPHELLWAADGSLLVANGGIPTSPETGRLKIGLERMDPSLVRLDPHDGALRGQWRLPDPRLSIRHLANAGATTLGIALQAEHDDPAQRRHAPLLALFDGERLRLVDAPRILEGYSGAIAFAGGIFAVSCPRANGVALYGADGTWQGFAPLEDACALATPAAAAAPWAGGLNGVLPLARTGGPQAQRLADLRLDNHWAAL